MYRYLPENGHLNSGAVVYVEIKPEQGAGMVLQVVESGKVRPEMLAVLAMDAVEGGASLRGSDPSGPKPGVLPLPYPIP